MDVVDYAMQDLGYINKATDSDLYSKTGNPSYKYNMYTKYGRWYGLNPAAWCGMSLAFWFNAAGMDWRKYAHSYVPTVTNLYKSRNKYHPRGTYTPRRGDVIIFGDEEHVGLVEGCSGGYVSTIEGNAGGYGRVVQNQYKMTDSYIMGYGEANVNQETVDLNVKLGIYKNGSTPEDVFYRYSLQPSSRIGEVNRYEECTKLGTLGDKTIVLYKVDGEDDYKIGFVSYKGS